MKIITLKCENREPEGKSHAKRMRRAGRLPSVVYGRELAPVHVSVDMKEFGSALDGGARVVDLSNPDGESVRVVLKDVQYDALGRKLIHADFQRVDPDKDLLLNMPMTLFGVPKGVAKGGILTVISSTVPILCLPANIPEELRVDISELPLGGNLYAGDIELPENVRLGADPKEILIGVTVPRGVDEDEEAAEGEAAEGEAAATDGAEG